MRAVYIAGIATTRFGKFPALSVKDLTRQAVSGALADAGCALGDVQAAWFSNVRQGQMEGQNSIRGQCALRAMGVQGIPIVNVENACASSSTGVNQAYAALAAGLCDVALVVGAEKMFFPDKKKEMFAAFLGGTDVHMVDETHRRLADLGRGAVPAGVNDPDPAERSFFMDIYGGLTRQHMQRFGTTVRQLAAAAAKNHANSAHNPNAQYTQPLTIEQVLADRPVTWPLTRAMCAPLSDGAAAAVLCAEPALGRFARGRAARVLASVIVTGTDRDPDDYAHHCGRLAAERAYAQAGLGPGDMDIAEVHDATSFAEILQIENLGFCAMGEGGPTSERGDTALGGRIPVNTSGGLVSKGHPIAATGLAMMHEIVTQLRGEAGARQVADARVGIVENGGGFWGVEEAATAITILARA